MIEIYALKLRKQVASSRFEELLSCLPQEKQSRIKRFKRFEDSLRVLMADILVRTVIVKRVNIRNREISFRNNSYGKPFVENLKDLHFNVSHSGEWVVCAIDCEPIGIDIEFVKPIDFGIAERFFSKVEYEDLLNKNEKERLYYFYDLWTLKESYIKAVGRGLSIPLDSFAIRIENEGITLECKDKPGHFYLTQYDIDSNYKLSVCAANETFPNEVVIKRFDDICTEIMNEQ